MPDQVSNEARIEIESSTKPATYDSTGDFFLVERLNLTGAINETGGVEVKCNDTVAIDWTTISANALKNVTLWYNNSTGWQQIGTGNISNNGSGTFDWTVPDDYRSEACYIRIQNPDNSNNNKVSGPFIVKDNLTIQAPTSSSSWDAGTAYDINWTYSGPIENVTIEYSSNNTTGPWITAVANISVGSSGAGTYNWYINESVSTSANARIRIYDNQSPWDSYINYSDIFTVKGMVYLDVPNATNITLYVEDTVAINWSIFGTIDEVNLSYSNNSDSGPWIEIVNNLNASNETYNWTVPDDISTAVRVRVTDSNNPGEVYDYSDWDIRLMGKIGLTAPAAGVTWTVDNIYPVNWTPYGTFSNVDIIASTDGFSSSNWTIVSGLSAGSNGTLQTYNYTVEDQISDTVTVRMYDSNSSRSNYTTNTSSAFYIRGNLTVKVPNGNEVWYANDTQSITWDVNGTVGDMNITLRVGSGVYIINSSFPSGGSGLGQSGIYPTWTIFDNISSESCLINLTDADNSNVSDQSNSTFSIRPKLNITFPTTGTQINVYEAYQINWTYVGTNVSKVDIRYFNGSDGTYNYTIAGFIDVT